MGRFMSKNIHMMILNEDTRAQLLSKSKNATREKDNKNRYQKRVKSKVRSNVSQLNKIDFNQLFKDNIVTLNLEVDGETNTYLVTISFGGFLDHLRNQLEKADNIFSLRVVIRALLDSFNSDNVYIKCSCPDFRYRFAYWLSKNDIIAGNEKENRPSDITNPTNSLGDGCKHIMLVLSNTSWIIKLGSVITNYYNYMEKHYKKLWADIIYPAVWDKKYEEPIQLDIDSIDDIDELDTTSDMVDKSNIYARDKNKFKKGNTQGIRFAPKDSDKEKNYSIFDKSDKIDDNEEDLIDDGDEQ